MRDFALYSAGQATTAIVRWLSQVSPLARHTAADRSKLYRRDRSEPSKTGFLTFCFPNLSTCLFR